MKQSKICLTKQLQAHGMWATETEPRSPKRPKSRCVRGSVSVAQLQAHYSSTSIGQGRENDSPVEVSTGSSSDWENP